LNLYGASRADVYLLKRYLSGCQHLFPGKDGPDLRMKGYHNDAGPAVQQVSLQH
jgi:hypothetical protein